MKLKDQSRLSGNESEAGDYCFVVSDTGTGRATTVPHPADTQVRGHNLSSRSKIIIAACVIAGVIIVLYIVRGAFCDGC